VEIIGPPRQPAGSWSNPPFNARATTASWCKCPVTRRSKKLLDVIGKTASLSFAWLIPLCQPNRRLPPGRPPPESEIVYGSEATGKVPYLLEKRIW